MNVEQVSEYNRDQWATFHAVCEAGKDLSLYRLQELKQRVEPYLAFRAEVDRFQRDFVETTCRSQCFDTGLSACCGFESIITFFADHAVSFLLSTREEMDAIFRVLEQPNQTKHCVYLGPSGCLWKVRPITCAMFYCEELKRQAFTAHPESQPLWEALQAREKDYTWPVKPVLFNDLERVFLDLGALSPHMFFHQSPGLVRLKARHGIE